MFKIIRFECQIVVFGIRPNNFSILYNPTLENLSYK